MAAQFYGSLSLNKNELQHFAIHNLSTAPSNPSTGQVYFNTSTSKPMMYDGSVWVDLTASGAIRDLVGDFDASGGTVPTTGTGTGGAILKGDTWHITVIGTITGLLPVETLNVGDMLVAREDSASSASQFYVIRGSEFSASTTVAGTVILATESEVLAKTSTTKAVTPADLVTFARSQIVSVTTNGTTTSYTINHLLNASVTDLSIQVKDSTSGNIVWGYTITPIDTNSFTLAFAPAYPAGGFKVVLNSL